MHKAYAGLDISPLQDTTTNIYFVVGVLTTDPNAPVYVFQNKGENGFSLTLFNDFIKSTPADDYFDVPGQCVLKANVGQYHKCFYGAQYDRNNLNFKNHGRLFTKGF